MSEHEKKAEPKPDAQEEVIKQQEREETEPQASTVNWAWAYNFKQLIENREKLFAEQSQQDMTRRNMNNSLVDKLDNIFAVNLAESLSIERQDRAARLEQERQDQAARLVQEREDQKAKDMLFNNSHYYQMNWLYEFTDLALIDYLKSLNDKVDEIKSKVVVKTQ